MTPVDVERGTVQSLQDIAQMVWLRTRDDSDPPVPDADFLAWFSAWLAAHEATHLPYLAYAEGRPVGIGWLALLPRVPGRGCAPRLCGDVQSVYVLPEQRSRGIGASLMAAIVRDSSAMGLEHVTVHASDRAVTLYERAGFASIKQCLYLDCSDPQP